MRIVFTDFPSHFIKPDPKAQGFYRLECDFSELREFTAELGKVIEEIHNEWPHLFIERVEHGKQS
jgi:hypothetical protein